MQATPTTPDQLLASIQAQRALSLADAASHQRLAREAHTVQAAAGTTVAAPQAQHLHLHLVLDGEVMLEDAEIGRAHV